MSNDATPLEFLDEDAMKTLLNNSVSDEDTQGHHNNSEIQFAVSNVDPEMKLHYAWCLTHSNNLSVLKKSSALLEEIFKEGPRKLKKDSLFYLAVSETKQKNYCKAKKYIDVFLSVESTNIKAELLKAFIEKQLKIDAVKSMALVGAAAILGTLVAVTALGFALKRTYK